MLFPTIEFAAFFLGVFFVSWVLWSRAAARKTFLLAASLFFYGYWNPSLVLLLLFCAVANYTFGIALCLPCRSRYRRWILTAGVTANLAVLAFFKYADFALQSLNSLFVIGGHHAPLPVLDILLPVGVSFFTFQGISYLVDVYRNDIEASTSMLDVLLYIAFFPQLVAGPIVRASCFMPQLQKNPDPERIPVTRCLFLISCGLFKKVVVAHYLAEGIVEPAFAHPGEISPFFAIAGLYAFAIQLFCDFSAYSDIAIGAAGLLGYRFPDNFNQPFRAVTLQDFWRRWHISLSAWLKDYVYRPLGGSAGSEWRTAGNIFFVMLLAGIWHGAAWTFVVFGALHGLWLVGERWLTRGRNMTTKWAQMVTKIFGWSVTFHFILFTLIFFRSENFSLAWTYLHSLLGMGDPGITLTTGVESRPETLIQPWLILMISAALATHFVPKRWFTNIIHRIDQVPICGPVAMVTIVFILLGALGPSGIAPFIYFQF